MEFDKKTILAFVIIGLILILIQTDFYKTNFLPPPPEPTQSQDIQFTTGNDSSQSKKEIKLPEKSVQIEKEPSRGMEPSNAISTTENSFSLQSGKGENVTVDTDLYHAVFSTKGASLISWTLKKYAMRDSSMVQMIGENGIGNLGVLIPISHDTLDTSPYLFAVNKPDVLLSGDRNSDKLVFTLKLNSTQEIIKTFTFHSGRYSFDFDVELKNVRRLVEGYSYFVSWVSGLQTTEPDINLDMKNANAYALQGDLETFKVKDKFDLKEWDNPTSWVAIRTKYFALALIPRTKKGQSVSFKGEEIDVGQKAPLKKYSFKLKMSLEKSNDIRDSYQVFIGPLDYNIVKSYNVGLEKMMSFGMAIFRPFAKFVLWSFTLLHKAIPNYGWVIIVFSVLIKLLLFPLTRKSYQSMKEMQSLQPLMQEINEKYKDDAQKKQQETMKLYKEYGINPLGGCIPMLLQMPLLIALFNIFRTTIELRGASFIWWIKDLSLPDTVAVLPFTIPLYGNTVNILPVFMGVTMFFQQKMTMKDPKQKAMVYFMPIFLTLMFNSFPSGLNLYYALFNLFSIIQEKMIPYKTRSVDELKRAKKQKTKKRTQKYDYKRRR